MAEARTVTSSAQVAFSEALRVCKPYQKDDLVASYLRLAEQMMIRRRVRSAIALCLFAARAAGEAESRSRRLAMGG